MGRHIMYSAGDQFTTNYDDSTWTLLSKTIVIGDTSFEYKPGYIVKVSNMDGIISVSHELIEQGLHIKKLFKVS